MKTRSMKKKETLKKELKHKKPKAGLRNRRKWYRSKVKETLLLKHIMASLFDTDVDENDNDKQDIPLLDEPACSSAETITQSRLKHRKKKSSNEIRKSSFNIQSFVKDCTKWDDSEQQIQGQDDADDNWKLDRSDEMAEDDSDDDRTHLASKKQRNVISPFVVDTLSKGLTSLNLPKTLQDCQRPSLSKDKTPNRDNDIFSPSSSKVNNSTIVTACLSPTSSTDSQAIPEEQTSSMAQNEDENNVNKLTSINKLEESDSKEIAVSNNNSRSRHSGHARKNAKRSTDCSNNAKPYNLRSANVNTRQEICESPTVLSKKPKSEYKMPDVYCIRNIVIVIMRSSKSGFCFCGKLSVRVLYGAVRIYGAMLHASDGATEVYSPRGYSNIVIEIAREAHVKNTIADIWMALSAENITCHSERKLQIDIDKVQPGMAVLVLRNIKNNLTLFLDTYCHSKLFPEIKNAGYYSWINPKRAEIVLQAHLNFAWRNNLMDKQLIVDPCITRNIAEKMIDRWRANTWSCTLIAGGKNVGKSTSVRCLINSLLHECKKVVLIDVDPGQAECTPAGCISYTLIEQPLTGPNFTHLKQPTYQLFIEEINVINCITEYLNGIRMLIERLKACPILSRLPIVVNTMGFTQHIGWDLMIFTIKMIRPFIVLQIISKKKKNNYMDSLSAKVVNKLKCRFYDETCINWKAPCDHELCILYSHAEDKTQENDWSMEPYRQREIVMISYLSGILHNSNYDSLQYNMGSSPSIYEAVPYTAPFSSLCIIPQRTVGVPPSFALSVVNGNIVALCGIDLTEESPQDLSECNSDLRVLTQRSPLCTCYGFGIIRGVDMERKEVFINTPLPISIMQHVNCLAGCIHIPLEISRSQLDQAAPYIGGNMSLPTSREPRMGYFRMRKRKEAE